MYRILATVCLMIVGFFFLSTNFVFAARTIDQADDFLNSTVTPTGIPQEDVNTRVGTIIKGALRIVGVVFLILMVYGGFRWMTARGNEADIDAAKETIVAALIGLIVIIGAYAITNFITQRLIEQQTGPGAQFGEDIPQDERDAPLGCCEFKFNEIPTWTAYPDTTFNACIANCENALDRNCKASVDYQWSPGVDAATCDQRRQDGLR